MKNVIKVNKDGIPNDSISVTPFDWQNFSLVQNVNLSTAGLYKATIIASWTCRQGKNHTRRFETWLAEEGLNEYYTRST